MKKKPSALKPGNYQPKIPSRIYYKLPQLPSFER